jgi:hypothetical protein
MKVAYHFSVSSDKASYGADIFKQTFTELLQIRGLSISTKVSIGDLLIWPHVDERNKGAVLSAILQLSQNSWKRFKSENAHRLLTDIVFIMCFETISRTTAEALDEKLLRYQNYLGVFEIDDADEIHWHFYGECIGPRFRVVNKTVYVLSDTEDAIDKTLNESLLKYGFDKVEDEFTDLRYTIFDDNHNYDNARRLSEWKKHANDLLGTVIDSISSSLIDAAPDLSDKLWATLDTYQKSETNEQLAQVMASCRRTFEYVVDCIFPPSNEILNGHSLKQDKYKNRLYEFANSSSKSNTNIDLIAANTDLLFKQWDKLYGLANKGIHGDVYRHETRRCIIRTITLLDDIVSLRLEPFKIKATTDKSLKEFFKDIDETGTIR